MTGLLDMMPDAPEIAPCPASIEQAQSRSRTQPSLLNATVPEELQAYLDLGPLAEFSFTTHDQNHVPPPFLYPGSATGTASSAEFQSSSSWPDADNSTADANSSANNFGLPSIRSTPSIEPLKRQSGQPNLPSPFSLFLNFPSFPSTPFVQSRSPTPPTGVISQGTELNETVRGRIQHALRGLNTFAAHDIVIPELTELDRYWAMYFAKPNRNMPLIHKPSIGRDTMAPALILAILGDGAMYCGEKATAMALYEGSRRITSNHIESYGSDNMPLWAAQTLLLNGVFGLPGGDHPDVDVTLGALQGLLKVAGQLSPRGALPNRYLPIPLQEEWETYIDLEQRRRTKLGILVMVGLWSTAFGNLLEASATSFNNAELPSSEVAWTAASAELWKGLNAKPRNPAPRFFQAEVEALLNGTSKPCNGFSTLILIVGLLLYADEMRHSLTIAELKALVNPAIDHWGEVHHRGKRENLDVNFISIPSAAYLRLSFEVDIRAAMPLFLAKNFSSMRLLLREGDLFTAAEHAIDALVPWAVSHKNRISMVSLPCALVISEYVLFAMQLETISILEQNMVRKIQASLRRVMPIGVDCAERLWEALTVVVGRGPLTVAISQAMDAYAQSIAYEANGKRLFASI